jgi:hypothetical protein
MAQKIITKAIEELFEKYPLYSQENAGGDAKVLCKIFNPYGSGSWYITEVEKQEDGDYRCFGLVNLYETELGYFMLSELLNARINVFGSRMPLERDTYFVGKTLRDAYKDCGAVCIFDKKAA